MSWTIFFISISIAILAVSLIFYQTKKFRLAKYTAYISNLFAGASIASLIINHFLEG